MKNRAMYLIMGMLLLLSSCEKEGDIKQLTYRVDEAYTPVEISYRRASGEIITVNQAFESVEDEWNYQCEAKAGDIFYASVVYNDTIASVKVAVLIDGKVYREKYSEKEPRQYITVSGTIP